jgi:hypothetical protein
MMSKSWLRHAVATLGTLALLSAPAYAGSITYSVTNGGPGNDDTASAAFTWGSGVLDITLTNTGDVTSIANILDGLAFTTTGGSNFTVTGVTASGVETCTTGTCVSTTGTSPFGWTLAGTSTKDLFAGGGSFKPYGIVNSAMDANLDGLKNAQHNPYLLGPVLFAISYTGDLTAITSAKFYFGTGPDIVTGGGDGGSGGSGGQGGSAVPEPASMFLLGTGLCAAAMRFRRKKTA